MDQQEFLAHMTSYQAMSEMLKTYEYNEVLASAASLINAAPEALEQYPMGGYSKGKMSGAYKFVLQDLQKNILHYDWLFSHLEDDTSQLVFSNLIGYRIVPSPHLLQKAYDGIHPQYFDKSIIACSDQEVFVDCGGFVGNATEEFIRQFKNYRHIYVYEPSPDNLKICRKTLSKYDNISIHPYGIGEQNGSSIFSMPGQPKAQNIEIVSLDDSIKEKVTFIKMNINGAEIPALLGAKNHIRDDFPKLAICAYHVISDIWEIPKLIDTIHPGYRFYIRHYDHSRNSAIVIYAVPPNQKEKPVFIQKECKQIVALAADEGWKNVQLIKECGSIPYILHKNHHCNVQMVGGRLEKEYPNLDYINGVKMKFLSSTNWQDKADYLRREAQNIDALLLRGPYPSYFPLTDIYKTLNPDGKVYLALDANSAWMDRIQWTAPSFLHFMEQCDVIASSGHTMQKHLNEKWPWEIEYIPNGFYDFTEKSPFYPFNEKENIILTVGRLGTPQKATYTLLEAFAQISDKIPDWKLHLAGSTTEEFEDYMARFWKNFPSLKDRIFFLGNINDRHTLYEEYAKAKIFALPSTWEGGTPNVIAEALYFGASIAITKIDEYEDAIDHGRCGMAAEIGDLSGFSDILLQLCLNKELEKLCCRSHEYFKENFDMEKITARLYYMLFGGEK